MRTLLKILLTVFVLAMSATTARAMPINITVDAFGNLLYGVGIADKTQYDQPNNSPLSNLAFLNTVIDDWNGVVSPMLPGAGILALNEELLSGFAYTGPSGYEYVVFHVSPGPSLGLSRGYWAAYYLGGNSISLSDVPDIHSESQGVFLSARYFGRAERVPEPGSLLLLGSGLLLVLLKRPGRIHDSSADHRQ